MKKTFEFTLIQLITILVVLLISLISIFIGIHFSIKYLVSHESTTTALIGAIGNFSGGLIGGIVAYLVAAYQINKTKRFDEIAKNDIKNSILLLIKSELRYNYNIINKCKEEFSNGKNLELLKNITSDSWTNNSQTLAGKINITLLESLITLNALISTYKNTVPSIPIQNSDKILNCITKNLEEIEKELKK